MLFSWALKSFPTRSMAAGLFIALALVWAMLTPVYADTPVPETDHPGSGSIETIGVWGGLIEENDRFILVEYSATEEVPTGGAASGTAKWILTLNDSNEDPIQSRNVPALGPNLAVFYVGPDSDGGAEIPWAQTLYVSIQENPVIFQNVAAPNRLVAAWVYDVDETDSSLEDGTQELFDYVEAALERFESTDDSTEELVDHGRITNAGLSYIDAAYPFWRTVLRSYFSTQLEFGSSYTGGPTEFSDELGDRVDSEFTQDLLALFSTFGIPAFVAGIMALMGMGAATVTLMILVGGSSEHAAHALPFLGAAALAMVMAGLASAALVATITFIVFLLGAGTIVQKYVASS